MSRSPTALSRRAKDTFWRVVEDCLVIIHQLAPADARMRTNDLRVRVENPPRGIFGDLIYHDEPFDVACDLAGKKLDLANYRSIYDQILSQHNW